MRKHCGYARVAFNASMSEWLQDNSLSLYDIKRIFNAKKRDVFAWCGELSQNASKNAMHDFWDAVSRWRSGQNKFPKRRRKKKLHYTASNGRNSVKVEDCRIQLPKIGWVQMRESVRFDGDILRVTISERAGKWFASILVETNEVGKPDLRGLRPVGVDVGINHLATTDDGTQYANPRALRRNLRKLARHNRKLSRCVKFSKNWYKAKRAVSRLHDRIACIRKDAHHKASTAILNTASVLCVESLTIKGLLKNRKLARALSDASLSSFLIMLKYKALARGVPIVLADKWYPSSKLCSQCRKKNTTLTLADRTFVCECGHTDDRDVNAAQNLKFLADSYAERINACGETISPSVVTARLAEAGTAAQELVFC